MRYEFSEHAKKQLLKMDRPAQEQIKKYMDDISTLQDPRSRGKALKGNFADLWRYRSGDYRIICDIQDERILITILRIGHRKEVYT